MYPGGPAAVLESAVFYAETADGAGDEIVQFNGMFSQGSLEEEEEEEE